MGEHAHLIAIDVGCGIEDASPLEIPPARPKRERNQLAIGVQEKRKVFPTTRSPCSSHSVICSPGNTMPIVRT